MWSDLTARALVRDAALGLFAEHGPDAVTVRQVAEQAEVSPALVLHHYGSKAGLREAVDAYAADTFEKLLDDVSNREEIVRLLTQGGGGWMAEAFTRNFPPDSPLPAYLRRLMLSNHPVGERLFRQWHQASLRMLQMMEQEGLATPSDDPEVRAAFLLVNDLAVILLRHPIAAALGTDPLGPEGLARWAEQALLIYRDGAMNPGALPAEPGNEPKGDT